jgi:hypothetical protein
MGKRHSSGKNSSQKIGIPFVGMNQNNFLSTNSGHKNFIRVEEPQKTLALTLWCEQRKVNKRYFLIQPEPKCSVIRRNNRRHPLFSKSIGKVYYMASYTAGVHLIRK